MEEKAASSEQSDSLKTIIDNVIHLHNYTVDADSHFGRILGTTKSQETNSTLSDARPPKTEAQVFMTNLIYGITAFIALVAFILCCVAIYLLCSHCHQNRKVVVNGKEYFARPPSAPSVTGSETSRDLMGLTKTRDSDMSSA